jgi:hypothetical protein
VGPEREQLSEAQRLEFAWRAHEANVAWVRAVDQKASIVLVVALTVGTVFTNQALAEAGTLNHVTGFRLVVTIVAGLLLAAAALLALLVVRPTLKAREARESADSGLIYFGHLRYRAAAEIAAALGSLDAPAALSDLSRQLAAHGDLSWKKHRGLQRSLESLLLGVVLFVAARFLL